MALDREPQRIETEVLPPEETEFERDERFIRWVSQLMDTAFTIPGTRIKFGLDPIIGLLPGAGDTVSALISGFLLSRAARYGVPKIVMMRMALNVVINTVVGALPVVGDAFSVWFKSNAMNYDLVRKHALRQREATSGDWVFVVSLLTTILFVMFFVGVAVLFVLARFIAFFIEQ